MTIIEFIGATAIGAIVALALMWQFGGVMIVANLSALSPDEDDDGDDDPTPRGA